MIRVERSANNEMIAWSACIGLIFSLAGCGGGGGSGDSAGTSAQSEPEVICEGEGEDAGQCSLEALGVNVEYTPRVVAREDGSRVELPEPQDFSPAGASARVGGVAEDAQTGGAAGNPFAAEMAVSGIRLPDMPVGPGRVGLYDMQPGTPIPGDPATYPYTYEGLRDLDPWTRASLGDPPAEPIQASVAADMDDDPLHELVVVFRDGSDPGDCPRLAYYDRSEGVTTRHSIDSVLPCSSPYPDAFEIEAGDFDGDGRQDLAVAYMANASATQGATATVYLIRNEGDGVFARAGGPSRWSYSASDFKPQDWESGKTEIQVVMEAGELDWDNPHELVVVVNIYNDRAEEADDGRSRFYVYDPVRPADREPGESPLRMKLAAGDRPPITQAVRSKTTADITPRVADVALGDFDADGLQEIALAGLTAIGDTCGLDADYTITILRDLFNFTSVNEDGHQAGMYRSVDIANACSPYAVTRLAYAHAAAGNLDKGQPGGDADIAEELVVNNLILDDIEDQRLREHPVLDMQGEGLDPTIPNGPVLFPVADSDMAFHWRNSDLVAADFTNDGRDNIAFHWRPGGDYARPIRVWGTHDLEDGWFQHYEVAVDDPTASDAEHAGRLQLVPVDWSSDGPQVKYEYGGYQLVFTEPKIIAAVAAPPCNAELGQSLAWCYTTYGATFTESRSEADGSGIEMDVTAYGSFSVDTELFASDLKVGGYLGYKVGHLVKESYSTRIDRTRATGALESSVVFHSTPVDTYLYRVVSHPDPSHVGKIRYVRLPRSPVTLMAPIQYFNKRLASEARDLRIDRRIFEHEDGKPETYPSCDDMRELRNDPATQNFIPTEAQEGSVSFDVGPGSGFTSVGIATGHAAEEQYSEMTHDGFYMAFSAKGGWKYKVGVGAEFKVGPYTNQAWTHRWAEGEGVYSRVTQVEPELYPEHAYRVGMFQYTQEVIRDNGMPVRFDVVNFWTTPYDEVPDSACGSELWNPGTPEAYHDDDGNVEDDECYELPGGGFMGPGCGGAYSPG